MPQYLSAAMVGEQLEYSERMIRNYAEKYDWFGGRIGENGAWVFTQDEVDRLRNFPRPTAGRPRNPIVATESNKPAYVPI